jgi:hypothetical protein
VGYFKKLLMGRRSRSRGALSVLTLGALVGGLLLPRVHVHLDVDHEGHEHSPAVVHQHWEEHEHESSGTEIEHGDDDGRVFFLDDHAIVSSTAGGDQSAALSVPIFFLAPSLQGDVRIRRIDSIAPSHGPPRRVCALRGPPCLSI